MTSFDLNFCGTPDSFSSFPVLLEHLDKNNLLRQNELNAHAAQFTKCPATDLQTDFHRLHSKCLHMYRTPRKLECKRSQIDTPPSPSKHSLRGDRFITDRRSMNLDISHFALSREFEKEKIEASADKEEYRHSLALSLFDSDNVPDLVAIDGSLSGSLERPCSSTMQMATVSYSNGVDMGFSTPSPCPMVSPVPLPPKRPSKILSFANKVSSVRASENRLKALYSTDILRNKSPLSRIVPMTPERVLDIPDIINDYYLNLLDWSSTNILAIALKHSVYLWNAFNADVTQLLTLENQDDYVSSLAFSEDGRYLAVGVNSSTIRIWDVACEKQFRKLYGHLARVCSLSWNDSVLTSGSRDTNIFNHDIRQERHHISSFQNHTHEVCGLKWSPEKLHLVSGGNDNILNVWSLGSAHPIYTFTQHQAAVKAIAWCPWQRNLLASGGGAADRKIRFWNTGNGSCLNTIDTKSQVGSLLWSRHVKELISSHGYSQNQITIWKYPRLTKQVELSGHTNRILHMAMSPDGTTIASASGDETLRFWKIFNTDFKHQKRDDAYSEGDLRLKVIR
ncbi:anaphase-promoting complex subunit cdc20-like [Schistocerca gregaria]|uniref:anaphase-promoting complex subunit cdc20-like n=1 Tax=Schistocerca gregaria TaxID=7010 RepID=UPI00211DC961|nr:anaphase-promoting complex subunit cdc20-like [Schistocerca gregaria]